MSDSPWRVAALRRLLVVQVLLDVQLWFPVWLVFLTDLGFDLSLIGLVDGMFRTTVVVAEVPCGRLVDRLGGRRSLVLVGLGTAVVHVAIATIGSTAHLVTAWVAWGVLWALASGVAPATLADLVAVHAPHVDRAVAFGQARAASSLAVLVSHLAAGVLLGVAPRGPFLVTAALGVVAAVVARGLPRDHRDRGHGTPGMRPLLRRVAADRALLIALATGAVVLAFGWSIRIAFQPLLLDLRLPTALIGVAYLAYSAMGVVGGLVAPRLARWSPGRGITVATTVAWVGVAGTAILPELGPWVFVPLVGLGFTAAWTLAEVRVTDLAPMGTRATALSLVGMVAGVAIAVTRPALAWIVDLRGAVVAHAVWAAVGLVVVGAVAALARSGRRPGRRSDRMPDGRLGRS